MHCLKIGEKLVMFTHLDQLEAGTVKSACIAAQLGKRSLRPSELSANGGACVPG